MAFSDNPPNYAIVQKVEDKKYAEEQLRLRRKEEQDRKLAIKIEQQRKLDERQKIEKRNKR